MNVRVGEISLIYISAHFFQAAAHLFQVCLHVSNFFHNALPLSKTCKFLLFFFVGIQLCENLKKLVLDSRLPGSI